MASSTPFGLNKVFDRLCSLSLWLMALLHALLLISFLLIVASLSPAQAEEECRGENLLAKLERDDPKRYSAVVKEGLDILNGEGLFWKIERQGLASSYLLGTMHVTDPRVLQMPSAAAEAHASASTIVIESDEILDEAKATAAILTKPELTMFTDGQSIESLLSVEDRLVLEEGLKDRGLSLSAVSRMKPWMLAGLVASSACELARKAEGAVFLDKKIALDAMAAGKSVKGLETLAEQLEAIAEMPMEFHLQALVETVRLGEDMDDVLETMTELYLAGKTGMTLPALRAITPSEDANDESVYAAFESAIISGRNKRMASRAAPIVQEGSAFIAVGALHLPGQDGLVELLREQGFTVSRIR